LFRLFFYFSESLVFISRFQQQHFVMFFSMGRTKNVVNVIENKSTRSLTRKRERDGRWGRERDRDRDRKGETETHAHYK